MPIIASPAYYNPQLGQAGANMLTAIFGNPEARMKADYYNSEVQRNAALADKTGQEAARLRTGNAQFSNLPDIFRQLAQQPGEAPEAWAVRTAPIQGQLAQAYPSSNIEQVAKSNTSRLADIFGQGGVDDMARSLVLQGHTPGKDFAPTTARADAVSARDAAESIKEKEGVANIQAGSAANVARIGLLKPTVVGAGATGYAPQGSPLYNAETGGKLPGLPTKQTAEGEAGTRLLSGDPNPALPAIFDPGSVQRDAASKRKAATPGKGPLVSQAVLDGIEATALKGVGGATGTNPKTGKTVPLADVFTTVDPAKRQHALTAAGQVYASTKDTQAAANEYLKQMGIAPGSTYSEGGWFSDGGIKAPAGAPAAPAAPVAAAPAGTDNTATGPGGVKIFHVNGQWVDGAGRVVQ